MKQREQAVITTKLKNVFLPVSVIAALLFQRYCHKHLKICAVFQILSPFLDKEQSLHLVKSITRSKKQNWRKNQIEVSARRRTLEWGCLLFGHHTPRVSHHFFWLVLQTSPKKRHRYSSTLFHTKTCHFSHPFSDQFLNVLLNLGSIKPCTSLVQA